MRNLRTNSHQLPHLHSLLLQIFLQLSSELSLKLLLQPNDLHLRKWPLFQNRILPCPYHILCCYRFYDHRALVFSHHLSSNRSDCAFRMAITGSLVLSPKFALRNVSLTRSDLRDPASSAFHRTCRNNNLQHNTLQSEPPSAAGRLIRPEMAGYQC